MRITTDELRIMGYDEHGNKIGSVIARPYCDTAQHGEAVERESDLHQSIMDHCKRGWPEWPCIHSSMSHRTHATLGAPDFIILAPGRLALFIECKSKTGKRTIEQLAFAKQAEMVGHTVYEVRSMDDFNAVLKEVGL